MPEIVDKGREIIVRYRRPSGGAVRSFDLVLQYLNGTLVAFALNVERVRNGGWKVLQAAVDAEETDADPEEAAGDLADVWWYIFPAGERGRVLPPVLASWRVGDLVLAACLSQKYGGKRLPLAEQDRWFDGSLKGDPPDPGRFLCWWPDPAAWETAKLTVSHLDIVPAESVAVNFFTFREWFGRADVALKMDGYLAELEEAEDDPDAKAEALAEIRAEEYARYVRRLRTMLLYCRGKGVPVEVVAGNVSRAEAYFAEKRLDPLDPSAWAAASCAFGAMPDFLVEEQGPCGPLGVAVSGQKLRAAVSFYSHWPGASPGVDAVGAAVYAGAKHLASLVAWLNPLADWNAAAEKAADALFKELRSRGVREMAVVDGVLPFEACPCCGALSLRAPDAWQRPEPVRVDRVERNDPCPCGSGLKHKKCCGKTL